jgi:hypothetical protein
VLNIEHFRGDTHDGRPLPLRFAPPHSFPAPPLTFPKPRRTSLVHHTRTLTEATTERYWSAPTTSATKTSRFLSAATIGTRHHDGIPPGWSPLSRSALNGISPNIFFLTLAIFTKRDGEGGIRLFIAQLPMSVVTQLKKPCQSEAVRQGWRGDLEQSDARRWGGE